MVGSQHANRLLRFRIDAWVALLWRTLLTLSILRQSKECKAETHKTKATEERMAQWNQSHS